MSKNPTHSPAYRVLRAAMAEPWAITAEGLELVLSVAARENDVSPEALEAYRARHVATAERLQVRGPVAIIEAVGPMFRRANIFTALSGATSYDILRRDLQAALDDPKISAIVLNLDTPGGAVSGVDELAKAIFDGRQRKPIVAYIGGTGASAGYWLASAASEVVVSDAAIVGSIGVRMVAHDTTDDDKKSGRVEFISSQSPGKRADVASDEGRARIQRTVDALADVFVAAVAKGRGVSAQTVLERFGAGDVLVGAAAVKTGMADRLGSFEAVVAELAGKRSLMPSLGPAGPTAVDPVTRIKAILGSDAAKGREDAARHLALNTPLSAADAVAVLRTVPITDSTPAPAPRAHADAKPTAGLVKMDPRDALPRPREHGASWDTVLCKLNGGRG